MKLKKKICEDCQKECSYWKGRKCKSCSFRANPQKPIKKSGSIAKISEKGKIKKALKTEKTKEIHQAMYNFWTKSNKRCTCCSLSLSNFATYMVDHLLAKSTYPELALEEANFFLCCLDCHTAKEAGFPKEAHKKAIEITKQKYGK